MTNEYYEKYGRMDERIFKKQDTDIVPFFFKTGKQVSYGTAIGIIEKLDVAQKGEDTERLSNSFWDKAHRHKIGAETEAYTDVTRKKGGKSPP